MKFRPALTLIEILVVVTLVGLTAIPFYFSYLRSQSNQALFVSSEQLSDTLRTAHVFSREVKDKKIWRVRIEGDDGEYYLEKGDGTYWELEDRYFLEPTVIALDNYVVAFNNGDGRTSGGEVMVELQNRYGRQMVVQVLATGVVEVYGRD